MLEDERVLERDLNLLRQAASTIPLPRDAETPWRSYAQRKAQKPSVGGWWRVAVVMAVVALSFSAVLATSLVAFHHH